MDAWDALVSNVFKKGERGAGGENYVGVFGCMHGLCCIMAS